MDYAALRNIIDKAEMFDKIITIARQTPEIKCSFCHKPKDEAYKLVAGPHVYICDECIELCAEIIIEEDFEFQEGSGI